VLYKIGVTYVPNGHVFYTLLLLHDNLINLFQNSADRILNSRVSVQFFHEIYMYKEQYFSSILCIKKDLLSVYNLHVLYLMKDTCVTN